MTEDIASLFGSLASLAWHCLSGDGAAPFGGTPCSDILPLDASPALEPVPSAMEPALHGQGDGPWFAHFVERTQADLQKIHDGTWTAADEAHDAALLKGLRQSLCHAQADLVTQQGHQDYVNGQQFLAESRNYQTSSENAAVARSDYEATVRWGRPDEIQGAFQRLEWAESVQQAAARMLDLHKR